MPCPRPTHQLSRPASLPARTLTLGLAVVFAVTLAACSSRAEPAAKAKASAQLPAKVANTVPPVPNAKFVSARTIDTASSKVYVLTYKTKTPNETVSRYRKVLQDEGYTVGTNAIGDTGTGKTTAFHANNKRWTIVATGDVSPGTEQPFSVTIYANS